MRVNLGCGQAYMPGWVNVDDMPDVKADVYANAFDFVREHGHEVTELYMGHFLEHLMPTDSRALLALIVDRLPADAEVSAVTPDIRAIFDAYERGEIDSHTLNASFIYSYVQPSHHVWCFDEPSLVALFEEAGFSDVRGIDPLTWAPVFHKEGPESRWQCGVRGSVPASRPAPRSPEHPGWPLPVERPAADDLPVTAEEVLLNRIERLRDALARQTEIAEAATGTSSEIDRLRAEVEHLRGELDAARSSTTWKVGEHIGRVVRLVAPPGTARRRALGSLLRLGRTGRG